MFNKYWCFTCKASFNDVKGHAQHHKENEEPFTFDFKGLEHDRTKTLNKEKSE